jgi:hypothetical protein
VLISHSEEHTLDDFFYRIRKQGVLEEAEEPGPGSEERITTILTLTESLHFVEGV